MDETDITNIGSGFKEWCDKNPNYYRMTFAELNDSISEEVNKWLM